MLIGRLPCSSSADLSQERVDAQTGPHRDLRRLRRGIGAGGWHHLSACDQKVEGDVGCQWLDRAQLRNVSAAEGDDHALAGCGATDSVGQ